MWFSGGWLRLFCCYLQASLLNLFTQAGFECEDVRVHERQVQNRAKDLTMERRWIQAVFRYRGQAWKPGPAIVENEALPGKPFSSKALPSCMCI